MTKWQLFSALVSGETVTIPRYNRSCAISGKILGIELESGGGHCFNVTIITAENIKTVIFVRTID